MRHTGRTMLVALVAVLALAAVSAAPALASGKPTAETKPATSVGEITATLKGTVNPNGAETKYYFEYGTTTKYGSKTAELSAGSGTTNLEESKAITGLATYTTYHFRVVAKNANGTTDGLDESFTTTPKAGLPEFAPSEGAKFPMAFTYSNKFASEAVIESANWAATVFCSGSNFKGEITTGKLVSLTTELKGCVIRGGTHCTSTGAKEGEIILPGTGELVYTSKASKQVAILLTINEKEMHCGLIEGMVRGKIVEPATPVNTKTTTMSLTVTGSKGFQSVTEYENEKGELARAPFERELGDGLESGDLSVTAPVELTTSKALTIDA